MMDTTAFRAAFPRQLRYWSLHCLLNALPSLGIAACWMELWKEPAAMAAMFAGIGSFILLYAGVTSAWRPLSEGRHILSRSLKLGAKIRAVISAGSLPLLVSDSALMWTPDFWCGWATFWITDTIRRLSGLRGVQAWDGGSFLQVYATTMLEGFILSFLLLMISFFSLIFVQARDRRKDYAMPR